MRSARAVKRRSTAAAVVLASAAGCSGGDGPATVDTTVPAGAVAVDPTLPAGELVAVPYRNRNDVATGAFQVKLVNGSEERIDVASVQFVWTGFTTGVVERVNAVVPGQRVDFAVPFPGASCAGDGTPADMPDLAEATVELGLVDGSTRTVPVVDQRGVAAMLYRDDCARQHLATLVSVEWTELRAATFEGRPVTEGLLRLVRKEAVGEVRVTDVSNTTIFTFTAVDTPVGQPVVVLAADRDEASAPVRLIEGRCDVHALSETSQPFAFVAEVVVDGSEPVHLDLPPPLADQIPMRERLVAGCDALQRIGFIGQDDLGS